MKILNLGCGQSPLKPKGDKEYINMDMLKFKADKLEGINYVRHDIMKFPWPFADDTFDEVFMFHTIEHIPENWHRTFAWELRRVLKPGGKLAMSYPEFTKVAKNYITNHQGKRDFWKATIYGRGLTEWDRHKALMDTPFFIEFMAGYGLKCIRSYPEKNEPFNTVAIFEKGEFALSYEGVMEKEFA